MRFSINHTAKALLLATAVSTAAGSCSDNVVDEPTGGATEQDDLIRYQYTTEQQSRTSSANIYSTTNAPGSILVWSYYYNSTKKGVNGQNMYTPYFECEEVTRSSSTTTDGVVHNIATGTSRWPINDALSFFAVAGLTKAEVTSSILEGANITHCDDWTTGNLYTRQQEQTHNMFSWIHKNSASVVTGFKRSDVNPHIYIYVPAEASSQKDILYAHTKNQRYTGTNSSYTYHKDETATGYTTAVKLNFRHAMSQHVVKVQVDNPTIYAVVRNATINNIFGGGDFFFVPWGNLTAGDEYSGNTAGSNGDQNNGGNIDTDGTNSDLDDSDYQGFWDWSTMSQTFVEMTANFTLDGKRWYTDSDVTDADNLKWFNEMLPGSDYTFKFNSGSGTQVVNGGTAATCDEVMMLREQHIPHTTNTGNTDRVATKGYTVWNGLATVNTTYDVYWTIDCAIYNKADITATPDTSTDVKIFDGTLYVKPSYTTQTASNNVDGWMEWLKGRKYTHTFKIGAGGNNGFKDGDPSNPVLVAISYQMTSESWNTGDSNLTLE